VFGPSPRSSSLWWHRREQRRVCGLLKVDGRGRVVVRVSRRTLPAARIKREAVSAIGDTVSIGIDLEGIRATCPLDGVRDSVTVHVLVRWTESRPHGGTIENAVVVRIRLAAVRAQSELFGVRETVAVAVH